MPAILTAILTERNLVLMILLLVGLSILFLWPGIVEFGTTAHTTLHWSRLLAGSFTLLAAGQTAIFALLTAVISLWMRYRTESQQALEVE